MVRRTPPPFQAIRSPVLRGHLFPYSSPNFSTCAFLLPQMSSASSCPFFCNSKLPSPECSPLPHHLRERFLPYLVSFFQSPFPSLLQPAVVSFFPPHCVASQSFKHVSLSLPFRDCLARRLNLTSYSPLSFDLNSGESLPLSLDKPFSPESFPYSMLMTGLLKLPIPVWTSTNSRSIESR